MQKRFITCALILLVVGLLAGCGLDVVRDSITFEGQIEPEAKLYVESFNGDVRIVPAAGDDIELVWETWATGDSKQTVRDFLNSKEIVVDGQNDEGVTKITATREHLSQPNPTGITNFGVNFTLKVPMKTVKDVVVQTSNGTVHVDGVVGDVSAESSNANVDFVHIIGDMTIKTSNGSVSASDVAGTLDIQTSNGDVKVNSMKVVRNADIHTSDGKINYQSLIGDANSQYILRTSNGPIEIHMPRSSDLSFYAETSNGVINCELPITDTNPANTVFEGNLNAGGAEVNAQTSNGDIHIYNDIH